MKTYWWSGGTAPHILNLAIRWKLVVSFTPALPHYPQGRMLGGPHRRSGRGGKEEKIPSLSLRGTEPRPPSQ